MPDIRPCVTLPDLMPEYRPIPPPTSKAADIPPVNGARATPAIIGRIVLRKPASGSPVRGLIVNSPP